MTISKIIYYLVFICIDSGGCDEDKSLQGKSEELPALHSIRMNSDNIVNYKENKYKLFIGQDKDLVNATVDLRHDYLTDDGIADDKGVVHYMNIGEDLIKMDDNEEVLLALFFTMNKKKLVAFECSIVFTPDTIEESCVRKCLDSFGNSFSTLNMKNKQRLASSWFLKIDNKDYKEKFELASANKYQLVLKYKKAMRLIQVTAKQKSQ